MAVATVAPGMREFDPRQPAAIARLLEQKPEAELAADRAMRAELAARVAPNARCLVQASWKAARIETVTRVTRARRSAGASSVRSSKPAGERARRGHG